MVDDTLLTSQLEDLLQTHQTPGLQYILADKDKLLFNYSGGLSNIARDIKVTEATTFNAYSVTKTFTALAILQLAEQDKLAIDESITKYFPSNPYGNQVTVRHLLSHTAGLPNPLPLKWIHLAEEAPLFDAHSFINDLFRSYPRLKHKPGEKFAYSNLGYLILGQIIENVSGITYRDYIRTHILQPISNINNHLDFQINSPLTHAKGYQKTFSLLNLFLGLLIDKSKYMDAREGSWSSFKPNYVNGAAYGGLIGSATGFACYLQELLKDNSKLIANDYKKLLFTRQRLNKGQAIPMTLGWFSGSLAGKEYFAHPGGGGGYYCELRLYPSLQLGSVIMFNRSGIKNENFLDKIDSYAIS